MKFSTSKIELQKALQKLSKATPTRSTLPILSCVLVDVDNEKTVLKNSLVDNFGRRYLWATDRNRF